MPPSDDWWFDGEDDLGDADIGKGYPSDFDPFDNDGDFYGSNLTETQFGILEQIEQLSGTPPKFFSRSYDEILAAGEGGQVRGVRFANGAEALIWLFTRGIYQYSKLVKFDDGSWGVAIGSSEGKTDVITQPGIPF